jgi:peptidoglycan/xylan/chitin deacetylase (PgdA/CDA1 family)
MDAYLAGGALPRTRAWLRARPRLQGLVLSPFGLRYRLPHTAGGIYVLLYHGVGAGETAGLRHHLQALLDRGRFLSWDESLAALSAPAPLPGPQFCLTFDDGHKEWVERVLPLLTELNVPASFFVTTNKVSAGRSSDQLTWNDCTRLLEAGMHIGSHSTTHARLAALDLPAARREVQDSKAELEDRLGVEVPDFSVPFGLPDIDYTGRDVELVIEAGYRSCASSLPGRMTAGDSPYDLRRCGLSPAWALPAVAMRVHE